MVFTQLLRSFEDAPDPELFARAWGELGAILRQELKRRGLWASPPAYFGIYGWAKWDGGEPRAAADEGPLAELTAECYAFIFVDRLAALRAQLAVKPNIEGLVLLNVRHFLLERQRAHDPIGYRVFEMLQSAVLEAVAAGELFVLAGDPRVRNDTLLGLDPGAEREASAPDLSAAVARWNDDLLPGLLLARGRQQEEVLARLRTRLRSLRPLEILAFRFRDALDPLKRDTRTRWAALMEEAQGERPWGEPVRSRMAPPERAFEAEESFADLARQVTSAIEGLAAQARTRRELATLWEFLWMQASESPVPAGGARLDEEEWSHLSVRRLAQLLDIPRERLPGLFTTLRRIVAQYREKTPVGSLAARRARREDAADGSVRDRERMEPSRLRRMP